MNPQQTLQILQQHETAINEIGKLASLNTMMVEFLVNHLGITENQIKTWFDNYMSQATQAEQAIVKELQDNLANTINLDE